MSWDFMGDLRTWLRTDSTLTPLHGGRVFFRFPTRDVVFPLVRIYRAGGSFQPGEAPIRSLRLGIDVFGGTPRQGQAGTFQQVEALTNAIEALLQSTYEVRIGGTFIADIAVSSSVALPDPDTGAPRNTVSALLTLQQLSLT